MSNQPEKSVNSKPTEIKHIEPFKFYLIFDGSPTGHPGYVVSKDDANNRYLVIRLDSDKPGEETKEQKHVRHITKLKHPTSPEVVNSYVKNRPTMCKRKDIRANALTGISFHSDDMPLIEDISKRNPEYTSSFKTKK